MWGSYDPGNGTALYRFHIFLGHENPYLICYIINNTKLNSINLFEICELVVSSRLFRNLPL